MRAGRKAGDSETLASVVTGLPLTYISTILKRSQTASITVVVMMLSHCTNRLRPQSFPLCGRWISNLYEGLRGMRHLRSGIAASSSTRHAVRDAESRHRRPACDYYCSRPVRVRLTRGASALAPRRDCRVKILSRLGLASSEVETAEPILRAPPGSWERNFLS